jgi:hypothetical protein
MLLDLPEGNGNVTWLDSLWPVEEQWQKDVIKRTGLRHYS